MAIFGLACETVGRVRADVATLLLQGQLRRASLCAMHTLEEGRIHCAESLTMSLASLADRDLKRKEDVIRRTAPEYIVLLRFKGVSFASIMYIQTHTNS